MNKVYIDTSNIISSLGFNTEDNFNQLLEGNSAVEITNNESLSPHPIPASIINNTDITERFQSIGDPKVYTKFEQLAILSVHDAIEKSNLELKGSKILFILSTTKGNVELLDENLAQDFPKNRLKLQRTAKQISDFFNLPNAPQVISNACTSGVAAIVLAQRMIKQGAYDHVIVNGTDVLSRFVVSGFQSFLSLSEQRCKPFDGSRNGLSLGEGSATIVLTKEQRDIEVVNGATSNDANHISGPSRTGEGLLVAINKTIENHKNIDLISAHGTATPYNDDMESVAITRAGLKTVPTNSLKGYFGHTLGAAGVIESIISLESLKRNILINTLGCENKGVAEDINVILETKEQELKSLLKLASGFGGGNAAALFIKHE